MSETYQSKRERWERLRETLPANLREHVSLRNVEAVVSLSEQAQQRLAEAIEAGLKRLPRVIEKLKNDPDTSVEELLKPSALPAKKNSASALEIPPFVKDELADMIQLCFPEMTRISAEALVEADVMEIAWQTLQAHHQVLGSNHLKTDFVMVIEYGLMRQTLEHMEEIIQDTPALKQAITQSPLPWKPNERRKQNA